MYKINKDGAKIKIIVLIGKSDMMLTLNIFDTK